MVQSLLPLANSFLNDVNDLLDAFQMGKAAELDLKRLSRGRNPIIRKNGKSLFFPFQLLFPVYSVRTKR